jgi:hypothetical protein
MARALELAAFIAAVAAVVFWFAALTQLIWNILAAGLRTAGKLSPPAIRQIGT